ncbi:cyclase family protein [Actinomadura sp. ATCC 31491]|uniref:Cyclase family protein n=1 Tax=Actinomadura luzonensis TaxID=2805427 RepID=A0ABT0G9K6_9ACTN|nr:cyclase family protein [Actinomadura luzonensis]MCK2221088.1 cyclase family protein [Actinomadura luzonensis]
MRIIDLSSPIDARGWEPDPVVHERMTPAEGARHMSEGMRERYGLELDPADLPDGEFLDLDFVRATTHTGTHVDAPAHYGSKPVYGPPRTIDQVPLDWFHRPGFVLDLTGAGTGAAGAAEVRAAIERTGYAPRPMDIALLHTGADARQGTPAYFAEFTGLDGEATEYLLGLGVRVIGTDAFSLDAPFPHIIERYRRTRDRRVLWPAHLAGRRHEYCQIERLANLAALPPHGFTVCCFPVKIAGAGAGWARAVALLDD